MRTQALGQDDPRLSEFWKEKQAATIRDFSVAKLNSTDVVILGYPDDEGVRLNRGRPGAHEGPARILYYLGRMIYREKETPQIFYIPHLQSSGSLEDRHRIAEESVFSLLEKNYRVITLGGGHDYGFPDASAYYRATKGKILNIDAHLDVRPVLHGALTSGTPFRRYVERFGGTSLVQWGIQPQCNSLNHRRFAKESRVKVFSEADKMPKIPGKVGLSVCLDAFEGIRGVSAPCFYGLKTAQGVEAVQNFSSRSRWMGIYECAPHLDQSSEDSARYGALLAYLFIHSTKKKK